MENLIAASHIELLTALLPASFLQAGLVGKLVMSILAATSLWSWILIGEGLFVLARLKRAVKAAKAGRDGHWVAPIMQAGREASELSIAQESPSELRVRVCEAMNRVARELLTEAEGGLPNLAVISSVSPFIGLFGTVWGIMTSFAGIADAKDTSLAVVAPGIVEALLATALGLAAAIPALIAYNRYWLRVLIFLRSEKWGEGTKVRRIAMSTRKNSTNLVMGSILLLDSRA
jgi:biopolymer transport protein ExbB/TolQ